MGERDKFRSRAKYHISSDGIMFAAGKGIGHKGFFPEQHSASLPQGPVSEFIRTPILWSLKTSWKAAVRPCPSSIGEPVQGPTMIPKGSRQNMELCG